MARVEEVVAAAEKLGREKDEDALELLLGMRDKAIEEKPALSEKADIKVEYAPHMGLIDELNPSAAASRWNGASSCTSSSAETERTKIVRRSSTPSTLARLR